MDDELTSAGKALRKARANLFRTTCQARAAASNAAAAGTSEVVIARLLGIDRHTVRAWLDKPRKR